ncbi:isopenicillin N synthase family dioxygenase [Gayadomonas joobiniege]|uniref:isopenicillin N synthase family dioxygenase n=1 Tax=Gayadomonas joobiniege TaxID=1234606 RepID=UPI000374F6AA|nr:2-oxoglutarate and iron-dependent oxygenase domain-containing protein [Gayadomonas joobiniege]
MSECRAFSSIPVIDISGLYSDNLKTRQRVADKIAVAAQDVGFFYIREHQISQQLIDNLIEQAQGFFAQPLSEKMRWHIAQSENHSGYVPEGEEQFEEGKIDHKEAYDINYDLTDLSFQRPMLGPTQWPDNADFKFHIKNYYQAARELSNRLFSAFALALGLEENTFVANLKHPPNQLRLIHYPYDPSAQDKEGIGAHTDYECFTLLLPTTDGLEVMNDQGEWIDAPFIPGTIVVNIGDMLEILSHGRFLATSHRVRKVKQERYSFPMFCSLDYDTLVAPLLPPAEGVQPGQYQALKCGDHLYAQTIQTFNYLKKQWRSGTLTMPDAARSTASFGQLAKTL